MGYDTNYGFNCGFGYEKSFCTYRYLLNAAKECRGGMDSIEYRKKELEYSKNETSRNVFTIDQYAASSSGRNTGYRKSMHA